MIPLPSRSPFTGGEIVVTRFYCPESDSSVEGHFSVANPFAQLSSQQLEFVDLFVRCEGRISRMEGELGLSYPTIRSRLKEIVEALGHDPVPAEEHVHYEFDANHSNEHENADLTKAGDITPAERQRIIQELDEGNISFEEAMNRINQSS